MSSPSSPSSPRSPLAVAVIATLVAAPSVAAAHIQLVNPAPRSLTQKTRPCGPANSTRGPNVTVLEPGAMLEVRWNETINHPGYYRISLDLVWDTVSIGLPSMKADLSAALARLRP